MFYFISNAPDELIIWKKYFSTDVKKIIVILLHLRQLQCILIDRGSQER